MLAKEENITIACSQKQLASCSLLLAAFSEIYISHMLSSQKKYHQAGLVRNVFVLDEIASLGAIPSLSDYLARGRKYAGALHEIIGSNKNDKKMTLFSLPPELEDKVRAKSALKQ